MGNIFAILNQSEGYVEPRSAEVPEIPKLFSHPEDKKVLYSQQPETDKCSVSSILTAPRYNRTVEYISGTNMSDMPLNRS